MIVVDIAHGTSWNPHVWIVASVLVQCPLGRMATSVCQVLCFRPFDYDCCSHLHVILELFITTCPTTSKRQPCSNRSPCMQLMLTWHCYIFVPSTVHFCFCLVIVDTSNTCTQQCAGTRGEQIHANYKPLCTKLLHPPRLPQATLARTHPSDAIRLPLHIHMRARARATEAQSFAPCQTQTACSAT